MRKMVNRPDITCLSPYPLFHAWSASLVAMIPPTAELITAVIGLWMLVIVPALAG